MITTKKFNYLLILINLILIVTIFTIFFTGKATSVPRFSNELNQPSVSDASTSTSKDINRSNIERAYYMKSVESFDVDQCANLSNELKEICSDDININKAYVNSDISFCEQIINPKLKIQCENRLDQ